MVIGFTGTQRGMLPIQQKNLLDYLENLNNFTMFVHGCCVGADEQACHLVRANFKVIIVGRPSDITKKIMNDYEKYCNLVHPRIPPLDRNKLIVNDCGNLIACPAGVEETRSGTWSTIRYARRIKRSHTIYYPDGKVDAINY